MKNKQHSKRYSLYEDGVQLYCGDKMIMENSHYLSNFMTSCCIFCGMEVATIGHSPDTDIVQEFAR